MREVIAFAVNAVSAVSVAPATPALSSFFDAFKTVCAGVGNFDSVGHTARRTGWAATSENSADPRIIAIVAKGRDAVVREEPTTVMTGDLFRRTIDGRTVYLATSRVTMKIDGKNWFGNGCRAYDLDAPAAIPTRTLTGWVGAPPSRVQGNAGAVKALWQPWQPGTTLEITYVPRDNALGAQYGIQGLVLVSQATGGF